MTADGESGEIFDLETFEIFKSRGRQWDPTKVWRKLMNHPTIDVQAEMDRMARPADADDSHEAFANIVEAARPAFDLPEFDGETGKGVTESEVLLICRDFIIWCMEFKKKLLLLPTRWQLMARLEPSADPSSQSSDGPAPSTESE